MSMKCIFTLGILNCLILIALADDGNTECDKSQCKGPLQYYNDLKCKPIYKTPESCCPDKFDCHHLKERPKDKCRIKDHDYNIGETLRHEDGDPCDIDCICIDNDGLAEFTCAQVDCFSAPFPNETCYQQQKATDCCSGPMICPEKPEDRPTCEVDGKVYQDGENFKPASEPQKDCYCGPGYKGENIEPFCINSGNTGCGVELHHSHNVHKKCAPIYFSFQSPQTNCALEYRCQNKRDEILKQDKDAKAVAEEDDMTCHFGNIVMHRGDELNRATHYDSVCVKCICEVGPVPTCRRLPENECDITDHPKFED